MSVRQTSIKTYHELIEEDLGERQKDVLSAFVQFGMHTDFEIVKIMDRQSDEYFYPNKVRPRRNELVEMGLLEEKYQRECQISGRTAVVWGLTDKAESQLSGSHRSDVGGDR